MITEYETKQIEINCPAGLRGYKQGSRFNIPFYKKTKIPVDPYWRRRFNDAKSDNCITVIESKSKAKAKIKNKDKKKDNKDECDIRA